jgi:phosphohistidine phosphatase SixA
MRLYFVRHAMAARKNTWRKDDDLRPLTRGGRLKFRIAVESLVSAGILSPERILTSPLVRATKSAAILENALGGRVPLCQEPCLGHTFAVGDLRALLAQKPRVKSLAIVGHNPSMCEVLSSITGGADIDLRKGAVALVEITDARKPVGRLMWLAPPTLFGPCP